MWTFCGPVSGNSIITHFSYGNLLIMITNTLTSKLSVEKILMQVLIGKVCLLAGAGEGVVGKSPRQAAGVFVCPNCGRTYRHQSSLCYHKRECGKEPTLQCPYCPYKTKQTRSLKLHFLMRHSSLPGCVT